MNWDKLDLHLENLIPGLAILSLVLFYWPPDLATIRDHTVVFGIAYVALGYLAGAVGNILARVLLDPVSARTFRTFLIRWLAKQKIDDLSDTSMYALNKRYSFLIDSAMLCGNESVVKEILKRRQTARLCRSALIPVMLVVSQIVSAVWVLPALLATFLFVLVLYGYSEVAIFTEAHRGFRILSRSSDAKTDKVEPGDKTDSEDN